MDIIQKEKNGIVCLSVKGRMEAEFVSKFETTINAIVKSGQTRLLFDLSALEYLKSPVLRVILKATKGINQKSGKVVLCCMNGYVKEIFEVNCHNNHIPITESVDSALNILFGIFEGGLIPSVISCLKS
jgi:anti-anti-sigma factor